MISEIARASRILVIDDDVVSGALVKRVLTQAGFAAIEILPRPEGALAAVREMRPHVVLLDLYMPGMDGFAVLENLREEAARLGSSIIMLTGAADHDVQVSALERGASDFVTKPFAPAILVARVACAAEMRELERRMGEQNARLQETVAERTQSLQQTLDVLAGAESELRRALERSETQARSRAEIIAELAQELRTPLSAVCGFADMMRHQQFGPLPPRYREYAEDIHRAGLHVLQVLTGFLDLAKAEARQEPLTLGMVDIAKAAGESLELVEQLAQKAGVELKLFVKPGLKTVHTDRTKLIQILHNLTAQAVKLTPAGGSVTVEAGVDAAGGAYLMVMRDSNARLDAALEGGDAIRFLGEARGASGKARAGSSGLPLTRQYVEMLGGSLSSSVRPGQGMAVTLRLPKSVPENDWNPATKNAG